MSLTTPETRCDICDEYNCICTEQEQEERSEREYKRGYEFCKKIHEELEAEREKANL